MNSNFNWETTPPTYNNDLTKSKGLPTFYDKFDLQNDFANVYEPERDTFLLIDSIAFDIEHSSYYNTVNDITSIEIGCGSGLVSACFINELHKRKIQLSTHYCVDINKDALTISEKLFTKSNLNSNNIKYVCSDLFEKFNQDKQFDIVIFNPPYVTTDDEEYQRALLYKDIYASWAGGKNGSETIFKFVSQIKHYIKDNGVLYLLLSKENEYNEILLQLCHECDFVYELLMKRNVVNEKLAVFKLYKKE